METNMNRVFDIIAAYVDNTDTTIEDVEDEIGSTLEDDQLGYFVFTDAMYTQLKMENK